MSINSGASIFGTNQNSTFDNLNVLNNLDVGNTINAVTVNATNGNFTNLTGSVMPGQVLIKRNETSNDNSSLVVGNTSATLANNSNGIHIGYNNTGEVGSIYAMNNSGVITSLNFNKTTSYGNGQCNFSAIKVNELVEDVTSQGISVNSGIKLRTNGLTYNDNIIIDGNTYVQLNSNTDPILRAAATEVLSYKDISLSNTRKININGSQCVLEQNKLTINNSAQAALTINSASGTNADWITANLGFVSGNRVVMGTLSGTATIGAHISDLTGWASLSIQPAGGANLHVGVIDYFSVNKFTCSGSIDVQSSYKINNACTINYLGGSTANTFSFPNKTAGSYTIATIPDINPKVYNYNFSSGGTLVKNQFFRAFDMNSTEKYSQLITTSSGLLKNLYVRLDGSPGAGVQFNFTVRVENVDTALTVQIANADSSGSNTGTSVSVAAGQLISIQFTTNNAGPYLAEGVCAFELEKS